MPVSVLALQGDNSSEIEEPLSEGVLRVVNLYHQGRFEEAELASLRQLAKGDELSDTERAELHRILAYVSVARSDNKAAEEQFIEALRFNPRLVIERNLTSPKILAVFDLAKAKFEQLSTLEKGRSDRLLRNYQYRLEGAKRSLILPGQGQFYKNQNRRGLFYITTFSISVTGLVASQLAVISTKDRYNNSNNPAEAPGLYDDYRMSYRLRNSFAISLGLVWASSVIDGLLTDPNEEPDINFSIEPNDGQGFKAGIQIRF